MSEKKEYIERSKVIDIAYWITLESGYERKMVEVDCVENMPAADVEPVVRGEWKPWETDDGCYQIGWRCSNCQTTRMGDIGKFCPECGAHMERSGSGE